MLTDRSGLITNPCDKVFLHEKEYKTYITNKIEFNKKKNK